MLWSTSSINKLASEINSGRDLKSIIREITIDNLFTKDSTSPVFPFFLTKNGSVLNTLIRGSNIVFNYTEDEIKKLMCYKENPISLLNDIYEDTDTVSKGLLNTYIDIIRSNRFNMILSLNPISAPINIDSIIPLVFMSLHYVCFNVEKTVLVYSDNRSSSKSTLLKYMLEHIPFFASPGIVDIIYSKFYMKVKFDNGCRIIVTNKPNIGITYDYIIFDNTIQSQKIDDMIISSSYRAGSQIHILTTDKNFFNSKKNSNFIMTDLTPKVRDFLIDDILD